MKVGLLAFPWGVLDPGVTPIFHSIPMALLLGLLPHSAGPLLAPLDGVTITPSSQAWGRCTWPLCVHQPLSIWGPQGEMPHGLW